MVDDSAATKTGAWTESRFSKVFIGPNYVHDDNKEKGKKTIRFAARLPSSGEYEVRVAYTPSSTRASAVPVTIVTATGEESYALDQRTAPLNKIWRSIGTFAFASDRDAVVTLSNKGTQGYVIADAVQFIPKTPEVAKDKNSNELDRDTDSDRWVESCC